MLNAQAKILHALNKTSPLRKIKLAELIESSVNYTGNQLSNLNKQGLIKEVKGYYYITPGGRSAIEADPNLTLLTTTKTSTTDLPKWLVDDLKEFKVEGLIYYVNHQPDSEGLKAYLQEYFFTLTPFVALYLWSQNKLPKLNYPEQPRAEDYPDDWYINNLLNLVKGPGKVRDEEAS